MSDFEVRIEAIRYYKVEAGDYDHAKEIALQLFWDDMRTPKMEWEIAKDLDVEVRK